MNKHNLSPNHLWELFELFCQYPRPSRHEEAVLQAIESLCDRQRIEHQRDDVGNLILRKDATQGMEDRETVVMQGHIDMVPQKNSSSSHDFLKDPIQTQIMEDEQEQWLTAQGTTLGADNGIGVAAALAVILSDDIQHGPLELLITIDEESGMTGAKGLQPGWLKGTMLLNLDTEDEGELYVGCAGGADISARFELDLQSIPSNTSYSAYEIAVTGLRGGHSGLDINDGRGNANKIINQFLLEHSEALSIRVFHFNGGSLRNAIARESFTKIVIPSDNVKKLQSSLEQFLLAQQHSFGNVETNLMISIKEIDMPDQAYTSDSCQTLLFALDKCIHGVTKMSDDFEGIVDSSNNLAIVQSENNLINVLCLARSLSDERRDELANDIKDNFDEFGATTIISGEYPGWQPNPQSNLLNLASQTYQELYGDQPKVKVIHAGLECGLLGKPYPHWDMISFGPTIRHAHSPDERVHIPSVEKFWNYLLALLLEIPVKH